MSFDYYPLLINAVVSFFILLSIEIFIICMYAVWVRHESGSVPNRVIENRLSNLDDRLNSIVNKLVYAGILDNSPEEEVKIGK